MRLELLKNLKLWNLIPQYFINSTTSSLAEMSNMFLKIGKF